MSSAGKHLCWTLVSNENRVRCSVCVCSINRRNFTPFESLAQIIQVKFKIYYSIFYLFCNENFVKPNLLSSGLFLRGDAFSLILSDFLQTKKVSLKHTFTLIFTYHKKVIENKISHFQNILSDIFLDSPPTSL